MGLSPRQAWRLHGIERSLHQSEPDLTAMLDIFTRCHADEAFNVREEPLRPCQPARSAPVQPDVAAGSRAAGPDGRRRKRARRCLHWFISGWGSVAPLTAGWLDAGHMVGL